MPVLSMKHSAENRDIQKRIKEISPALLQKIFHGKMGLNMKGQLFNVQRFSLDDGEGIRTIVFFKGCNQRCLWCHNPESLSCEEQIARVDSLCTRCGRCANVCPEKAIFLKDGKFYPDTSKCILCEKCIEHCPQSAIKKEGYTSDADEVIRIICKDRAYYQESGGGVTFSGGEPTFQIDFLLEMLKRCRDEHISAAIETNGNTPLEQVKIISPYLDMVMVDFKHYDPDKHRKFTGVDNFRTIESIKYYVKHNKTEVRIPIIPTFNDTPDELQSMLKILSEIGAKRVVLLPYHTFGVGKYKNLNMPYALEGKEKLEVENVQKILDKIVIPQDLQAEIHAK